MQLSDVLKTHRIQRFHPLLAPRGQSLTFVVKLNEDNKIAWRGVLLENEAFHRGEGAKASATWLAVASFDSPELRSVLAAQCYLPDRVPIRLPLPERVSMLRFCTISHAGKVFHEGTLRVAMTGKGMFNDVERDLDHLKTVFPTSAAAHNYFDRAIDLCTQCVKGGCK